MKHAIGAAATAAVLAVAVLAAQTTTPNFSGNWTLVPETASAAAGGMVAQSIAITQDANTITLTRNTQMGEIKTIYKLDGSESKNTLNFQGMSIDQVSTAKWDDGKLKIETSMDAQGQTVHLSSVLSLDANGNLVLESTRPDFQGGGAPITTKATYKKA